MAMYAVGATTYISEIAPPEIRGVMLSLFNVSILTWLSVFYIDA
jgi:hypothetical protein